MKRTRTIGFARDAREGVKGAAYAISVDARLTSRQGFPPRIASLCSPTMTRSTYYTFGTIPSRRERDRPGAWTTARSRTCPAALEPRPGVQVVEILEGRNELNDLHQAVRAKARARVAALGPAGLSHPSPVNGAGA